MTTNTGEIVPVTGPASFRKCQWCEGLALVRYLRFGNNTMPECRAVAACESRMR